MALPLKLKRQFCIYTDIKNKEAKALFSKDSSMETKIDIISKSLKIEDFNEIARPIILELYLKVMQFGATMDHKKQSTLLSIYKLLLDFIIIAHRPTRSNILELFKEQLFLHSVQRPPFSLCIFSS